MKLVRQEFSWRIGWLVVAGRLCYVSWLWWILDIWDPEDDEAP